MKYDKLDKDELLELIDKLEEEIYELRYDLNKLSIKNNKLELLISDIMESIKQIITNKNDRFNKEPIGFELSINNLINYMQKYCKDNNLYL